MNDLARAKKARRHRLVRVIDAMMEKDSELPLDAPPGPFSVKIEFTAPISKLEEDFTRAYIMLFEVVNLAEIEITFKSHPSPLALL